MRDEILKEYYKSYKEEFRYEFGDKAIPMSFERFCEYFEISKDTSIEEICEIFSI